MGNKYFKMTIDDQDVDFDINGAFPINIDYQLEDVNDFQRKKSSEALNIMLPATLVNDKVFNTFHNPSIDDTTNNQQFRGIRKISIEANGDELLVGKTFLNKVVSQYGNPEEYEISAFGNNADWMIDLKEATLFDFLKHISFIFSNPTIINSWGFNGQLEQLPYVFAPVKYSNFMDSEAGNDDNYSLNGMKPAISKYWIIYWAFKSLGYKIDSDFMNTDYYRRMVMPWTWGSFLTSEGTKYDTHNFLAKGVDQKYQSGNSEFYWNLDVSNDSTLGAFDNNEANHPDPNGGDYSWHPENDFEMRWTYRTPHYGTLEANFSMTVDVDAGCNGYNSELHLKVEWFKNDVFVSYESISRLTGGLVGGSSFIGLRTMFFKSIVNPDDKISARIHLYMHRPKTGYASCSATLLEFKTDYFKIPVGGTIAFDSYLGFKSYKFLDFLRGEADNWNLSFQTDSINKIVKIEPTHEYSLTSDLSNKSQGYFTRNTENWSDKRDLSKKTTIELYKDSERELQFKFKEDSSDGGYKVVKDRHTSNPGIGKYVFPDRFKSGSKPVENRFFSPTMHYEVASFKSITGIAPQIICLVPENISNTSSGEADNTFLPKNAYYKGLQSGVGGWKFNGNIYYNIPFMFAVNYKTGGEDDPILSYSDEKIGNEGAYVLGKGLLKRFFWQRLAIMRNGQYVTESYELNNKDVTNWFHRERILIDGNLWELITIKDYQPLSGQSTQCHLRRFFPIGTADQLNTYPTESSITNDAVDGSSFDMKYTKLMCLATDIPTPTID